jgi:hypothetical protein
MSGLQRMRGHRLAEQNCSAKIETAWSKEAPENENAQGMARG